MVDLDGLRVILDQLRDDNAAAHHEIKELLAAQDKSQTKRMNAQGKRIGALEKWMYWLSGAIIAAPLLVSWLFDFVKKATP